METIVTIQQDTINVITVGVQGPEGPQGVPGSGANSYKTSVELSGTKNGSNLVFTLDAVPAADTEMIFYNGVKLMRDVDYTIDADEITLLIDAPVSDDYLEATYFEA